MRSGAELGDRKLLNDDLQVSEGAEPRNWTESRVLGGSDHIWRKVETEEMEGGRQN